MIANRARRRSGLEVGIPLVLFLLALVLRLYRLGSESLWLDEADLWRQATRPWRWILLDFLRPGQSGPLYVAFMGAWVRILGDSEVLLRLPSALAGAAAVPLLWRLLRPLGAGRAGAAALLLALSPGLLWHSQEAKMYAPLVALLLAAALAYRRAWAEGSRRRWGAFAAWGLAAALTHPFALPVLAAFLLHALATGRRPRLSRRSWALLSLPFLATAAWVLPVLLRGRLAGNWQQGVPVDELLRRTLVAFFLFDDRLAFPLPQGVLLLLPVLLAVLGLVAGRAPRELRAFLGLWLLLPLGAALLLNLRLGIFQPRYLLEILPPLLSLTVLGMERLLPRRAPLVLPLFVLLWTLLTAPALRDGVYGETAWREQWREAVEALVARFDPERDRILVHPGYLISPLRYYGRDLPEEALVTLTPLPKTGFNDRQMTWELNQGFWGAWRGWVLTAPEHAAVEDPEGRVLNWFFWNTLPFYAGHWNGVRLYGYHFNGPHREVGEEGVAPPHPAEGGRGGPVQLLGAVLPQGPLYGGRYAPLALSFRWPEGPPSVGWTWTLRLEDEGGRVWRSWTEPPFGGLLRPDRWGHRAYRRERYLDWHDLLLPPGLPPGRYRWTVRLNGGTPIPLGESWVGGTAPDPRLPEDLWRADAGALPRGWGLPWRRREAPFYLAGWRPEEGGIQVLWRGRGRWRLGVRVGAAEATVELTSDDDGWHLTPVPLPAGADPVREGMVLELEDVGGRPWRWLAGRNPRTKPALAWPPLP